MADSEPQNLPLNRDPISGRETVFAARRGHRHGQATTGDIGGEIHRDCPFCPGNERLLADIRWHLGHGEAWRTRAVPNLYPIVAPPSGYHEVIIDSPQHRLPAADMSADNWHDLMTTYSARYHAAAAEWRYVTLYRNVGRRAGATIDHPHSQLVAMAHLPAAIKSMRSRLRRGFRRTGRCLLCDQVRRAMSGGDRVIATNSNFVVLVPEIPEVSFEIWIVPLAHSAVFARGEPEIGALASSLHDLLRRMNDVLGPFDHNMLLQCDAPGERTYLHWYFRIRPKFEIGGGFEMATGVSVNASRPEADAEALRAARGAPQT